MSDPNFNIMEWGAEEHAARLKDIADARAGLISLDEAQRRASKRRNAAGLSINAAAAAVSDHVRAARWNAQSAAIARASSEVSR